VSIVTTTLKRAKKYDRTNNNNKSNAERENKNWKCDEIPSSFRRRQTAGSRSLRNTHTQKKKILVPS
jgi:hypothetical protein